MTVTDAWRRARRKWRTKRRNAGQSWSCILNNHGACSGWIGRLSQRDATRPACTCPCHQEELL